jgi:hypothetical protein
MSNNVFEQMSKAFKQLQTIKKVDCLSGLINEDVYIKALSSKEQQDASPHMEIVDDKPVLVENQVIAKRIFYSLCDSEGKRLIKTDGEKSKQAALDVIDGWPANYVDALLLEIKSLTPESITEDAREVGKLGEANES